MDEMLGKLNNYFPNSKFVKIPAYDSDKWKEEEYDSSKDVKATSTKWKTDPLDYDTAVQLVDEGNRIGWIIPKGYVVVDIDNKEEIRAQAVIERLLSKFEVAYSYNYTYHGIHMLFQDPTGDIKSNAKLKCALNLVVDTRANETGYIVLPCNDPHRTWGMWREYVEDIPYFLRPILSDATPSFVGMNDGDGRNDALFKWKSRLEMSGQLSKAEVEKSIRIINENLFEVALSNKELFQTVLRTREEKIVEGLTKEAEKKNKYNEYADELINKHNIIAMNDIFYMFNGLYYKKVRKVDIEALIHTDIDVNIGRTGRAEIVEFVRIKCQHSDNELNQSWEKIAVKNGILNLVSCTLEAPTPTDYNTIGLDYNFNPDPQPSQLIIDFMAAITGGDVLKTQFLYEVAGYCLLKKNLYSKFFVFRGDGGTGKSTYTNLIQKMVGIENTSHISLVDFDKDYQLASIYNKLVNIDDDVVDNKSLTNSGRFKSLVAGELISARPIYKDIIEFVPFCTCIFSCNKLPSIMDDTSGMYRRIILVELNHKIENPDPLFLNKVTGLDMEYFLYKSATAISETLKRGTFTINDSEKELEKTFRLKQSALLDYICEKNMTLRDILGVRTLEAYSRFKSWCLDNGFDKPIDIVHFKEDICRMYNITTEMLATSNGSLMGQGFVEKKGIKYNYDFIPV